MAGLAWSVTMLFVTICWIPFRAENLDYTWRFIQALAGGGQIFWVHPFLFVALGFTTISHIIHLTTKGDLLKLKQSNWTGPAAVFSLIWLTVLFHAEGFTPFLYAQF